MKEKKVYMKPPSTYSPTVYCVSVDYTPFCWSLSNFHFLVLGKALLPLT